MSANKPTAQNGKGSARRQEDFQAVQSRYLTAKPDHKQPPARNGKYRLRYCKLTGRMIRDEHK